MTQPRYLSMATVRRLGVTWQRALQLLVMLAIVLVMGRFLERKGFNAASYHPQAITATWYCAGEAIDAHADPYRVEPLRSCELRHSTVRKEPWVEPAPLPGYALAAFGLLARFPFEQARTLWFYALLGAIIVTSFLLARLAHVPPWVALACLAMVDGYINLVYGELPPLSVAALVAAASLGSARRYRAAAVFGALAMIEPHVALPACLAMFVWWPRTRLSFGIAAAALAALSVATIGVAGNVEYFGQVLPIHAAAEIAAGDQLSLTRILHILGVPDHLALTLGSVSYLLMTGIGVCVAPSLARRLHCDALVPLYPSAVGLLGGAFIHDLQIAAALPAALLLATRRGPLLLLRESALVAIAFAWSFSWSFPSNVQLIGLGAGTATGAAFAALHGAALRQRLGSAVLATAGCFLFVLVIAHIPAHRIGPARVPAPLAIRGTDLASANWAAAVSRDREYDTPTLQDIVEKLPVWFGLSALTLAGVLLAAHGRAPRTNRSEYSGDASVITTS